MGIILGDMYGLTLGTYDSSYLVPSERSTSGTAYKPFSIFCYGFDFDMYWT